MDPPVPVQRVATPTNATGQIQSVTPEPKEDSKAPDFAEMAEKVWPHIRRKLRVERERERGLPS
jgi:hypothetical protein